MLHRFILMLIIALLHQSPVLSQTVTEFYQGKTMTMLVGSSSGGGYDVTARVVARHISRHIPGTPNVVVQNAPGARGLIATNNLYNLARRDGTVMGVIIRDHLVAPYILPDGIRYDERQFGWIGSVGTEVGVALAWHTAPHRTIEDIRKAEFIVGGSGNSATLPRIYNYTMGTKFKVITGYSGSGGVLLAMEKGEVQGIGDFGLSNLVEKYDHWLTGGKVTVLFQTGRQRARQLPDVPLATELAGDEQMRQILELCLTPNDLARPIAVPPGVPRDRLLALRQAFVKLFSDDQFLAEARNSGMVIEPRSGDYIEATIARLRALPPALIDAARAAAEQ